jgi:hypothetical protein
MMGRKIYIMKMKEREIRHILGGVLLGLLLIVKLLQRAIKLRKVRCAYSKELGCTLMRRR